MKNFFLLNLFWMFVVCIFLVGFGGKSSFQSIQTNYLELVSKDKKHRIVLGFDEYNFPKFMMKKGDEQSLFEISAAKDGGVDIVLSDKNMLPKVHVSTSKASGVFLKNEVNKTVGSFTVIQDGGGAFGLANRNGYPAALMKGGESPSVAFFSKQNDPQAAIGVLNNVPHLLISGPAGNEGVLIHGGNPNCMMVVDEIGKVKILISKHGVFQGKQEQNPSLKKKSGKVFSLKDFQGLFPEEQTKR